MGRVLRKRCRKDGGQSEGRKDGGQSEGRKAASKPAGMYFFKVLIGDFHSKLYIPPAFARFIEDDNSDGATLNTPVGCFQDIEVLKDSYSVYFHNGWREFVDYHSLQIGEFLVFRYDGGLQFEVQVFDRSGCEKVCLNPFQVEDKNSVTFNPEKNVSLSNVYLCDPEVSRNECKDEVAQKSHQRLRGECSSSKSCVTEGTDIIDTTPRRGPLKSKRHSVTEISSMDRRPS